MLLLQRIYQDLKQWLLLNDDPVMIFRIFESLLLPEYVNRSISLKQGA